MAVENGSITFRSSNQQETLTVSFSDSCDIIWNNSAVTPQLLQKLKDLAWATPELKLKKKF